MQIKKIESKEKIYKIKRRMKREVEKKYGEYILKKIKREKIQYGLYEGSHRKENIIISMASFSKRYNTICVTLKSLCNQSIKPDQITVWLDEDIPENMLTVEMEQYKDYGVDFFFTNDHLRSHKKYIYAMRKYPNAVIITVDDDVVYPHNFIKSLMLTHENFPECICARRIHKSKFNPNKEILPYEKWFFEYKGIKPSYAYWPTGIGGILYPPKALPDDAFDMEIIRLNCLNADDLWLKIMGTKAGRKVVWAKNNLMQPPSIPESQTISLKKSNVTGKENDRALQKLQLLYPEIFEIIALSD